MIWSVVTPQAVAYAQIAGLPPEAGLMAAPGAMLAYALLGTSRQLVVSATTATAAVSAASVGPLAHGDMASFAALSAALALVTAVVLVAGGALRLGAVADLVSKPVMTGFLFGLGMVITLAQIPSILGVKPGEGNFFPALADVLGELGDVHGATLAVGLGSVAVLLLGRRLLAAFPSTLLVLIVAIAVSALLDLSRHGVDVVGDIPNALPDPAIPHVSADDFVALVTAVVLVAGGALRLGAVADLVSKPVMTGFLFGLGMVIMLAQVPSILGVKPGEGNFFPALVDVLGELGDVHAATLAVGLGSVAVLLLGRRLLPAFPSTLLVLIVAIAVSALLDLSSHGVDVVGDIPNALPDPAIPHVSADDFVALVAPAFGILIMSAEAVGVARALAVKHGYQVDPNRDLWALGVSNLLAGLSSGFVQSGGASQTAAADGAGGRSQLASVIAAGLLLLTGAFLAPLFEDLPQATLGAIVIVAVSGFFDVAELRRFAHVRRSAIVTALLALAGVLALGVLEGLVVTAGLTLVYVVQRISRPSVGALARDPVSGAWGRADRHGSWGAPDGALVARSDGPLLYPNANSVKDHVLALVAAAEPRPRSVVLDLSTTTELDVQTADSIDELRQQLARDDIELRLAAVRAPARQVLDRAGVSDRVPIAATIDDALADVGNRATR